MAVGALVPIIIGAGNVIRMAAPKVAQMLIKKGVGKKASQAAVKKLRSPAKRINAKDANKLAARSKPFVQTKTGAARKPPKTPTQKKIDKAKPGDALVPVKSKSVAKRPGTAVAKRPGTAVAKRPSGAVTKVKGSKPSKGKSLLKKIGIGAGLITGGAAINEALDKNKSVKSKTKTKTAPPAPKRKPKIQSYKPDMPTGTKPSNQSSSDPFDVKSKKDEAISLGEYFKGAIGLRGKEGLEGKKRLVKTPFGNITVDTSPEAFEEPEEYKVGGRVKRNVGGKVRGVGQAVKGFGNATYSNKLI